MICSVPVVLSWKRVPCRGHLAISEKRFWLSELGKVGGGKCHWLVVSGGQGYHQTPFNLWGSHLAQT